MSGCAGTVEHLEIQHNTALQSHTPRSGWGWVEMGRRGGLGSQALSQLHHHYPLTSLGPQEAAAPIAPPSWGLEVPSGDHSDSGSCSFYLGMWVSPRIIKPLLFLLPKPSPVPGYSYLGSE